MRHLKKARQNRVMAFSSYKESHSIEELSGKLKLDIDQKLMHSVLENDKEIIDDAKLLKYAINQSLQSFIPDLLMEQFVHSYSLAKHIYGESLLQFLSGYDERYIEKNIKIPEFQRALKKKVTEKLKELRQRQLIDVHNTITEKGLELVSLIMYIEELDHLIPQGFIGERLHKEQYMYGDKQNTRIYKKGDRYKDIARAASVKTALRRQHHQLVVEDLKVFEREAKGRLNIIYALDASGSMKGNKIDTCKKAGIALAFKAIQEKDRVGLIVFGKEVKRSIPPTEDFTGLVKEIATIQASSETNLVAMIKEAVRLFPQDNGTNHLIILTDVLPTVGEDPANETLEAASLAQSGKMTISIVGINLDEKGAALARKIVEIGQGRVYIVKDLEEVDKLVLEEYYAL